MVCRPHQFLARSRGSRRFRNEAKVSPRAIAASRARRTSARISRLIALETVKARRCSAAAGVLPGEGDIEALGAEVRDGLLGCDVEDLGLGHYARASEGLWLGDGAGERHKAGLQVGGADADPALVEGIARAQLLHHRAERLTGPP